MPRFAIWFLLLASAAHAQGTLSLSDRFGRQEAEAFTHYRAKAWDKAIAAFEKQIAIYSANPNPYYNVACCYALRGDAERAATWLNLAIHHGWRDLRHLQRDPDFKTVRETQPYKGCVLLLRRALLEDPDPLPRRLPPSSVPSASSAESILQTSGELVRAVERQGDLLAESQMRRRLFRAYDRRMAMLTRYLMENGDARDADLAALARVDTARRYLGTERAMADDRLVRAATAHILAACEEFLRGWPGSPYLPAVLYWQGEALGRVEGKRALALDALQSLVRDHPKGDTALLAQVEVCAVLAELGRREDLEVEYRLLDALAQGDLESSVEMRLRLAKAHALLAGVRELAGLDQSGTVAGAIRSAEPVLYAFVSPFDVDAEIRLASLVESKARMVVVCVDYAGSYTEDEIGGWLKEHAADHPAVIRGRPLAEHLWIFRTPVVILARGEKVMAFDPGKEEIAKLFRQ
ncbi:MAG: TPR end-of-group domain-containing protein [Planctomycetota bacterium]